MIEQGFTVEVRSVGESGEALAAWEALCEEPPALPRHARVAAQSLAECLAERMVVAAARDARGSVVGVATAFVTTHSSGRRILTVDLPVVLRVDRCRSLWTAPGASREQVVRALLDGLGAFGREEKAAQLVLVGCPEADPEVVRAAEGAGARALRVEPDNHLLLEAAMPVERYLASLNAYQRNELRRGSRGGEAKGARLELQSPPTEAALAAVWPLHLELLERKQWGFSPARGNLFLALHRRAPETGRLLRCFQAERLVGFVLYYRVGAVAQAPFFGCVEDADFQVSPYIWPRMVLEEVGAGATAVCLGATYARFKARFGCVQRPRVSLHLRLG